MVGLPYQFRAGGRPLGEIAGTGRNPIPRLKSVRSKSHGVPPPSTIQSTRKKSGQTHTLLGFGPSRAEKHVPEPLGYSWCKLRAEFDGSIAGGPGGASRWIRSVRGHRMRSPRRSEPTG